MQPDAPAVPRETAQELLAKFNAEETLQSFNDAIRLLSESEEKLKPEYIYHNKRKIEDIDEIILRLGQHVNTLDSVLDMVENSLQHQKRFMDGIIESAKANIANTDSFIRECIENHDSHTEPPEYFPEREKEHWRELMGFVKENSITEEGFIKQMGLLREEVKKTLTSELDAAEREYQEELESSKKVHEEVTTKVKDLKKMHGDLLNNYEGKRNKQIEETFGDDVKNIYETLVNLRKDIAKYKINFKALLKFVASFGIYGIVKLAMRETKKAQLNDMIDQMDMDSLKEQTVASVESNIVTAKKIRRKMAPFARNKELRDSIETDESYITETFAEFYPDVRILMTKLRRDRAKNEMDIDSIDGAIQKLNSIQARATETHDKIKSQIDDIPETHTSTDHDLTKKKKKKNTKLEQEMYTITRYITSTLEQYKAKKEALTTSSAPKMT